MIITTDDLCLSNLKFFIYWDKIKTKYPNLKLIAFTIANFKNEENISESKQFKQWYARHKMWVEIGIHGYDHLYPPECERDNQEELILKALNILKPFLPKRFLYRAPGFQITCRTEPILKKLGFFGIAHENRIKYFFEERIIVPFNTHCSNKYFNPITDIWNKIII